MGQALAVRTNRTIYQPPQRLFIRWDQRKKKIMSIYTKIQWCHTTVNPVMGCDGCELSPTLAQVRAVMTKIVEPLGSANTAAHALILSETAAGPQHTKLNIKKIAEVVANAIDLPSDGRRKLELVRLLVRETSQLYRCYAAELHRFFNANGKQSGFASPFEVPKMFVGRAAKIALLPAPSAKETEAKPWLAGYRRLIFVSDMGDALSRDIPFEFLRNEVIAPASSKEGSRHLWLWVTKRPHRMAAFSSWLTDAGGIWPENLVAMTSITDTASISRIEQLRKVGARYHALSVEPLWSDVSIPLRGIDWVIVGGESGPNAKPFDLAWARRIQADCSKAGVPFFMKQFGARPSDTGVPLALVDGHGGDWAEWPADLRVRELPLLWREEAIPSVPFGEVSIDRLVEKALAGFPWSDEEIDALGNYEAYELVSGGIFTKLPKWAQDVVENILIKFAVSDSDWADAVRESSTRYPKLFLDVVRLEGAARPVISPPRKSNQGSDALRAEAYYVWKQIRHAKKPTGHPASLALMEKFKVGKAALAAFYANFSMGRHPKAA